MTTPRATRLVVAGTLPAFQLAIHELACRGALADLRRRVVLVPSRAAAAQLRHTLETLRFDGGTRGDAAFVLPDLLTRDEWYQRMHERAGLAEFRLTPLEREAILGAAAREAIAAGARPPFRLRPGLVAEMLGLYDALARHERSLNDFERIVVGELEPRASTDRGAERMLEQTRFLLATFRAFERRVAGSGALDEDALRRKLLDPGSRPAFTQIVVTVGDRAADPAGGLFAADFDLMMRAPGVEAIDIVATRALLASGLHERLDGFIPGLEVIPAAEVASSTRLIAPLAGDAGALHYTSRDREEELRAIARRVKQRARRSGPARALDRVAVVFGRPLPYVYLAATVFESAGVQFQLADALPLAAEPMAAVLDLVFAAVESRYARSSLLALLRSPHLRCDDGARPLTADEIDAFDRGLADRRYAGSRDALVRLADGWTGPGAAAARAAVALTEALEPLCSARATSAQAATLIDVLRARERMDMPGEAVRARHLRARGAILSVLDALRLAALAYDDPVVRCEELAATIRRWVEAETFSPRRGSGGVQVMDAQAARYGAFDTAFIAGLIEGDWPGPSPRNIFYPAFLLAQLGWPPESARLAAARAAFTDLLLLARDELSVSTFTLEDDAIVNPSAFIEEVARTSMRVERVEPPTTLVFADEALTLVRPVPPVLGGDAASWLGLRQQRTPAGAAEFHGDTGPARRAGHSVTSIDTYLQCPFKYFAAKVLELKEEVSDEPGMTPQSEGKFVHDVLREFFAEWQASGGGAITADVLDKARTEFAEVAARKLADLPAADAALQRARLLGSVGTPGLGELVIAAEAARPQPVRERLLEHDLGGLVTIAGHSEAREVNLRGKADRIDLLEDGTFRLVDYKSGHFPDPAQTIQLPVYAICAAQQLARTRGGEWRVREASYIAFGEPKLVRAAIPDGPAAAEKLADGQQRLLDAIDAIDRGEFPPRPAAVRICSYCAFATVCRKDYVDGE